MDRLTKLSQSEFRALWTDLRNSGDWQAAKYALVQRCRTDLELFCLVFFAHYCEHDFNPFHEDFFKESVEDKRNVRRVTAAPRGAAKSTFKTLIKPIHDFVYGIESFIVIISNTEPQAVQRLQDIRTELLENALLAEHFGNFFANKKVATTEYVATCNGHKTMFVAYGSGTEIRGARFGAHRPTKIILDDVEHSDEVYSEQLRAKYEDWFKQVVTNLGSEKTNIEFVGTVLHEKSLLNSLLNNPRYTGKKYKSITAWSKREDLWEQWRALYTDLDNDNRHRDAKFFLDANRELMLAGTEVFWPAKEPYEALMEMKIEMGDRAFFKEKQNEPIADDEACFKVMHWYVETTGGLLIEKTGVLVPWEHLTPIGAIDPATGQTKVGRGRKGDFACLGVGYRDPRGRLFVHADWTERRPPSEQMEAIFNFLDVYKMETVGIETNLYRNLYLPNLQQARKELEEKRRKEGRKDYAIKVSFQDIENTENKEKRIFSLEPKVKNGYILFNKAVSHELKSQFQSFPRGEHDDAPDMVEMLWSVANNRYRATTVNVNPYQGR